MKKAHNHDIEKSDIVISGGGTPGLTLGILLAQAGVKVSLIDPSPRQTRPEILERDTRTSALMVGSINILKATGVLESVTEQAGKIEALRLIEGNKSAKNIPQDTIFLADDINQAFFGYNLPNSFLRDQLLKRAQITPNLTLLLGNKLCSFEADNFGVTAYPEDGAPIRASLLIGADGRNSPTRKEAGISCQQKSYGQKALTCYISHSASHKNISTEIHRPGGPFAMVPLPGHISSIVWVEPDNEAEAFFKMDKASFTTALQERTDDLLGTITLKRPPQLWPLIRQNADRLTAQRVALVAEAAHVIHPLGAQGLNLSLRDCAALAEIIVDAMRTGLDPGSKPVLDQYEKTRRADIHSRVWGTDFFNRLVSTPLPFLQHMRTTGIEMINHVTPLRRLAMQQGITPDLATSRLARGEAL